MAWQRGVLPIVRTGESFILGKSIREESIRESCGTFSGSLRVFRCRRCLNVST